MFCKNFHLLADRRLHNFVVEMGSRIGILKTFYSEALDAAQTTFEPSVSKILDSGLV